MQARDGVAGNASSTGTILSRFLGTAGMVAKSGLEGLGAVMTTSFVAILLAKFTTQKDLQEDLANAPPYIQVPVLTFLAAISGLLAFKSYRQNQQYEQLFNDFYASQLTQNEAVSEQDDELVVVSDMPAANPEESTEAERKRLLATP